MTYDEMVNLRNQLGYSQFTKLQEKVFANNQTYRTNRLWVCGDTSSGKTLIPSLLYAQARKENNENMRMLYMVPYRALALQKYKEMKIAMKKMCNEHINIVISTAEYKEDDNDILGGYPDITIIIYEKAYIFIGCSDFIKYYDYVVFDEFGIVADDDRGTKVDLLMLDTLKSKKHVVVLSTPYIEWKDYINTYDFFEIREEKRPVCLSTVPIVRETQKVCFSSRSDEIENESEEKYTFSKNFLYTCEKNFTCGYRLLLCVNKDYNFVALANAVRQEEGLAKFFSKCTQNEFRYKAGISVDSELDRCLDMQMYDFFCSGIAFLSCELAEAVHKFVLDELKHPAKQLFRVIICTDEYMYCDRSNLYTLITVGKTRNSILFEICKKHLAINHKIIIFLNNRVEIHNIARDLYKRMFQEGILEIIERPQKGQTYKEMLMAHSGLQGNDDVLSGILEEEDCKAIFSGIGVHSAALPQELREYIEQLLHERSDRLKIVVSTETLAFGINSNADVVIIADLMNNGVYMNSNEYNNCAGRAGRIQNGKISEKQRGYIYPIINAKRLENWFQLSTQTMQRVENTLARLDSNHVALYILSLFRINKNMIREDFIHELSALPISLERLDQQITEILQLLTERKMLKCFRDEFLADEPLYCLTTIGEMMKSYPVSIQTYDQMKSMILYFKSIKELPLFDLIFYLCETEPMKKVIESAFSGKGRYFLDESLFQRLAKDETQLFKKGFLEERVISESLYIRRNREMKEDKETCLHIKATLALICWASGAKTLYIYKTFSLPYGLIKQMGEQMSYLIEVAAAVAHGNLDTIDFCHVFMLQSTSLFYGIPSEVLREFDINTIAINKRYLLISLNLLIQINKRNRKRLEKGEKKKVEGILKEINKLPEQCREKVQNMAKEILSEF